MSDDFDITRFVTSHGKRTAVGILPSKVAPKRRREDLYIGCPLEWLKRVIPIVKTKEQLAVALWLYRRYAACKWADWFPASNELLRAELGLSRKVKYATLQRLELAGTIALSRDNKRALQVHMLW